MKATHLTSPQKESSLDLMVDALDACQSLSDAVHQKQSQRIILRLRELLLFWLLIIVLSVHESKQALRSKG